MNSQTVKVSSLRTGNILLSGAKVISDPIAGLNTPKGMVEIGIEYANSQRVLRFWNKSTTVKIAV